MLSEKQLYLKKEKKIRKRAVKLAKRSNDYENHACYEDDRGLGGLEAQRPNSPLSGLFGTYLFNLFARKRQ